MICGHHLTNINLFDVIRTSEHEPSGEDGGSGLLVLGGKVYKTIIETGCIDCLNNAVEFCMRFAPEWETPRCIYDIYKMWCCSKSMTTTMLRG
jgi:hypothetical protein